MDRSLFFQHSSFGKTKLFLFLQKVQVLQTMLLLRQNKTKQTPTKTQTKPTTKNPNQNKTPQTKPTTKTQQTPTTQHLNNHHLNPC